MRRITVLVCLLVALVIGASPALAQSTIPPWRQGFATPHDRVTVMVGDQQLDTMLAVTAKQQQLGMGYRNSLGENEAMLFVGTEPEPKTFWMKGMRYCLDIIWVEGGKIVGAAENTCPDPAGTADADRLRVSSPVPVTHVLETRAGFLKDHGFGVGTDVIIPELP
jgi:uncharacterized membrane protein (UPF0127 family)